MAEKTITAANSVFMLSIPELYPIPQRLEGYTADAAFDTDTAEPAEVVMGVDGHMSAGYVPFLTRQTINIMPDSDTSIIFEDWLQAQKTRREVLYCFGEITLPNLFRAYTLNKGVMTSVVQIPGVRRVLQGRSFQITWFSIDPVPVLA